MVSKYYVTICLEPHYQQFLRSQFSCESEIFEFPPRHSFNAMLEHFVVTRPADYRDPEPGPYVFKIALPTLEYKNVVHFHYLTRVRETIFKSKIKEYYDWIIADKIEKLLKTPVSSADGATITLNRQECTLVLIEEYGFDSGDQDSFERLYKLFSRYKQKEAYRRFCPKRKNWRKAKAKKREGTERQ